MTDNGKPKYFSLMEQLRSDIMSGAIRPGEKLPSENELSQKYSLSRHTVRKALGILEQDGYVEAFHGRGTYCSENMRHIKNSKNIAVVTTYISDYIFPRLIQGMDNVLSESGYSIILKNTANSRQKEARCLEELLKKDIDGLIIEPSKSEMICKHRNLYQNLDKFEIPYVFIQGIYSEMRDKPHILMDDAQGGYLVTKYLLELGHKKIKGFSTFLHSTSLMIRRKRSPRSIRDVAIPGPVLLVNTSLAGSSLSPMESGHTLMPILPSATDGHTSSI